MLDFNLGRPQEFMQRMLRDFMQNEYPHTVVREAETTDRGYAPAIYRRLGELGVLGFGVPKAEGGADGGWIDLAVLYEEGGRALLASPHLSSVVLGAGLLVRRGSAAQRQAWVRDLVSGSKVLAVAWPLDAGEPGPSGARVQVQNGGYVLSGTVAHVPHAVGADGYLLVAEVADAPGRLGLFLAEPNSPGLTIETGPLMSGEPLSRVRLQDARLPSEAVVGEPAPAAEVFGPLLDGAKTLAAAHGLGGAEAMVDMAAAYAKERHQFNRPIGSFQAVQHRLANLAILVEEARLLVYTAAGLLDAGQDARRAAAMAKLKASAAFREASTSGLLVHGGYGFMLESNPQLYYRRAKALELAYGSPDAQRAVITTGHQQFAPS
jgi:alkylation response protein AidB-like acyl-CoA dehydrogenase